MPQRTALDVYAVGRLARMGYSVRRQRWLYTFRNRHGFTDAGDGSFELLWSGDGLTWDALQAFNFPDGFGMGGMFPGAMMAGVMPLMVSVDMGVLASCRRC